MIKFEVLGNPQGKARPRLSRGGVYTPKKTVEYEQLIKDEYTTQVNWWFGDCPLEVEIISEYPITKSITKRDRELILSGSVQPKKKPDLDNVAKVVCDALNGVAYIDDAQICKLYIEKRYSENPKLTINIDVIG